ncbi:MAG TPA: DUF3108 domain-containing protein [Bacteroidota bacterium]|nr:DUF3108 domain-containing protein [Bacteroidota bacterium]
MIKRRRSSGAFVGASLLAIILLAANSGKAFGAAPGAQQSASGQTAFAVGERLVFNVGYGFITAGQAIMAIPNYDTIDGHQCYKVTFEVNSTPTFSWFYEVRDRYETNLDAEGIFPWHFEQHIREGRYKRDFTADFDQINHIAKTSEKEYPIPPRVQDMMSAFYYARTLDFSDRKVGEIIRLQNFYKDSTYALDVKFVGRQTIGVAAGKFRCIVIEPLAKEGGLFKSDGKVLIWLSDDDRKIPVKVSTKVVIGSIDSELKEYSGINGPLKARIK